MKLQSSNKKIKINYDNQFKINKIINDETKRKKKLEGRLLKKMETNYKIKKKKLRHFAFYTVLMKSEAQ